MADRHGSKTNRIRISERPLDPGRNSFMLCTPAPLRRSTSGRPRFGPASASLSTTERPRIATAALHDAVDDLANELRHLGHDGVPTGGTAATCVNDGCTTDGCAVSLTTVGQSITSCPHPPMTRCVWSVT